MGNEIKQVISPTGNVGIGTTNPGSVLTINHVHPQIRFEDADGDAAHVTQVSSYDGTLYFDSDMANHQIPREEHLEKVLYLEQMQIHPKLQVEKNFWLLDKTAKSELGQMGR